MNTYKTKEEALEAFAKTDPWKTSMEGCIIDGQMTVIMQTAMAEDAFYDALEPVVKLLKNLNIPFDDNDWHELNQEMLNYLADKFETLFVYDEF